MDRYKQLAVGGRKSKVRVVKPELPTYSFSNPNPEWVNLGCGWIDYALNHYRPEAQVGEMRDRHNDVAYIPHIPLEIKLERPKPHYVLPTEWNLDELPRAANFYAYKGGFRLNAKQCEGTFVGRQHNVDLDAVKHADIVLDLLKLAEKIYSPP